MDQRTKIQIAQPSEKDRRLACEIQGRLKAYPAPKRRLRLQILSDDRPTETLDVPEAAVKLLERAVDEIADGNHVELVQLDSELTTQQAADILHVSRPYLISLLQRGEIPYYKVGTHRRVRLADALSYKRDVDARRLDSLRLLAEEAQELRLGY